VSRVANVRIAEDEADLRLDRWFRRHYPQLKHGQLARLMRTGQVRVDGRRAKPGDRVAAGQVIRVPPLPEAPPPDDSDRDRPPDAAWLRKRVLYRDDDVLAIDKPAGLAVQGGSGVRRHLDGLLDSLRFDGDERPKLVHRLDKDTSGVLLLARNLRAAAWLTRSFRDKKTTKVYWAVTVGVPDPPEGVIDRPIEKRGPEGAQKMRETADGRPAETHYRVRDARSGMAWIVLIPCTGRTHQLRVHMALLGTPIVGDRKYGGRAAFPDGVDVDRRLHLHARSIAFSRPDGERIEIEAPLPADLHKAFYGSPGFLRA